jgi:phosphoribosylformylglycinamidine synthase
LRLLASPNIASKEWVVQQYDHMVRSNTVVYPGSDAAVVRIKDTSRGLAMKTDCNARYVYLNPRTGAAIAVAESARNVVCSGGQPVAITNCLNFGNPYKPEIYWQFEQAVAGIGDACRVLGTPVTGGNVSFYNENPGGAVFPTPVIGMLGILDDIAQMTTAWFKRPADLILLLGHNKSEVGGSEYLAIEHGLEVGDCPSLDLAAEKNLQQACLTAIKAGILQSAHDISDGGLAVALAECCLLNPGAPLGASVELQVDGRYDYLLFGEDQSRIIVSIRPEHETQLRQICADAAVPMAVIGEVAGESLIINDVVATPVAALRQTYHHAIRASVEQ